MPSAGFLIIAFIALMLVIVPSALLFARGSRFGLLGRVSSVLSLLLLVVLGWFAFTDPESPDFESRAFVLFVVWGTILYSGAGVYFCVTVVYGLLKRRQT